MTDAVTRANEFISHQSLTGVCYTCCTYDIIRDLLAENEKMRVGMIKLITCEDESSWGDWVREIAREALR